MELARSLDELVETSDVVSLHLVLAKATEGIIGRKELAKIKKGAFLVNTSRGPLVDEDALVEALEKGALSGVGLDVFGEEPLPRNHKLRTMSNVVLSPHMGTPQIFRLSCKGS